MTKKGNLEDEDYITKLKKAYILNSQTVPRDRSNKFSRRTSQKVVNHRANQLSECVASGNKVFNINVVTEDGRTQHEDYPHEIDPINYPQVASPLRERQNTITVSKTLTRNSTKRSLNANTQNVSSSMH